MTNASYWGNVGSHTAKIRRMTRQTQPATARMRIYVCVQHARCVGGSIVTMGSVNRLRAWHIYVRTVLRLCAQSSWEPREENRQHYYYAGAYVPSMVSRTETREIVLSTATGEKKVHRPPRAPKITDRAETSTNVSGRDSRVRVLGVLLKSARRRRESGRKYGNLTNIPLHPNRIVAAEIRTYEGIGVRNEYDRPRTKTKSFGLLVLQSYFEKQRFRFQLLIISCGRRRKINNYLYFQYEIINRNRGQSI